MSRSAKRSRPKAIRPHQLQETCLAIADRLAKADPSNAGWQRNLWVSYGKVADVLIAQGDLSAGLKSNWQKAHEITSRLAKTDPNNAGWQRDLPLSYEKVGRRARGPGPAGPRRSASFNDSLAIRDRLAKADPSNGGMAARSLRVV